SRSPISISPAFPRRNLPTSGFLRSSAWWTPSFAPNPRSRCGIVCSRGGGGSGRRKDGKTERRKDHTSPAGLPSFRPSVLPSFRLPLLPVLVSRLPPLPPRRTPTVDIGGVPVGSSHPIVVQSMTNTDTADVEATVAQCRTLAEAGSELVRVTVNNEAAAE